MFRFVTFVDGSNLDGVLKHLNLRVDDYGSFYRHVFEQSVHYWGRTFAEGSPWPTAQHSRIYWYVVGKMDEWDLNDPKAEARLRSRFELNPRLRDSYLEDVARRLPDLPAERRLEEAWNLCFAETREWYEGKRRALERKKRFYHGVQAATDFVEIRQEGHWKVDLLHHTLNEKGLDTSLAVDMVALQDTYDIALLISGDADGIPGINYVKGRSKHVGRGRVPPRGAGRLPGQGGLVAAQDRRRLRRPGLRGRPDPPQPRLPRRGRLPRPAAPLVLSPNEQPRTRGPSIVMARPRAIVLRAPGTNCDEETAAAWERAGADVETWHVGRLLEAPDALDAFQILTIPGGFSYGDDLGAGRILATRLGTVLGDALRRFHDRGGLVLGICNGFQVLVRAGLLPGGPDDCAATLTHNDSGHFEARWVRLVPDARPLAVPRRRRADRAARRPRRGEVPPGRSRGPGDARGGRPDRPALRRRGRPADPGVPGQPQRLAGRRGGRLRPDRPDLRPDAPPRAVRRSAPPPPLDPPRPPDARATACGSSAMPSRP